MHTCGVGPPWPAAHTGSLELWVKPVKFTRLPLFRAPYPPWVEPLLNLLFTGAGAGTHVSTLCATLKERCRLWHQPEEELTVPRGPVRMVPSSVQSVACGVK